MTETFFIFAGWLAMVVVSIPVSQNMARARKRDPEGWVLLSAFVGPLSVLALYLLGEAAPQTREQKERSAKTGALISSAVMVALFLTMAIPLLRACFKL